VQCILRQRRYIQCMRGALDGQTSTFIIWRFRAKLDRVEEFCRVYGCDGDWAKLFMRSAEHRGTQLLQDTTEKRMFVVIDRWADGNSFTRFREEYAAEYDELDRQCLELTEEDSDRSFHRVARLADRKADPPRPKGREE